MREEKSGNRYFSFSEVAEAFGVKPKKDNTSPEKLNKLKNDFARRHVCRSCKHPLTWIGGSVMTCTNPECKGIKHVTKNEEGQDKVSYLTSYELLDEKGASIASRIYEN